MTADLIKSNDGVLPVNPINLRDQFGHHKENRQPHAAVDHDGQAPIKPRRIEPELEKRIDVSAWAGNGLNRKTHQANGQVDENVGPGQDRDDKVPAGPLRTDPEPADKIVVGAGGKLIVPRENIAEGIEPEAEVDLVEEQKTIRKPKRREWVAINHAAELTTRLLIHEKKRMEVEYFYVEPQLRGPIREELKDVRVFPFYSFKTDSYGLWIVKVTLGNSWYESLQALLSKPHAFFQQHAVRIFSDEPKYRVKRKAIPFTVTWLPQSTAELLGQALGNDHFITSPNHPVYVELVEGEELE
jgi:hypothetical protein